MSAYSRFDRISSGASAVLMLALVGALGPRLMQIVQTQPGLEGALILTGALATLALGWLALQRVVFPLLFRITPVRRLVLGRHYIEGTWVASQMGGAGGKRLMLLNIQPFKRSFAVSGHTLTPDLRVESNTHVDLAKLDWPVLSFRFRNTLSDGADGQSEGIGDIQFDMNESAPLRFVGFIEVLRGGRRIRLEATKLTRWRDIRGLRKQDSRGDILTSYWASLFDHQIAGKMEMPNRDDIEEVVHRRRASDWRESDATPAIDRIRKSGELGSKFADKPAVRLTGSDEGATKGDKD